MFKKIIFLCLIVVLSGCSVSYEVNLNIDDTFDEKIYFVENNSILSKYGNSLDNVINNMIDYYFSIENNIQPQILLDKNYNIKNIGEKESNISLTKKYNNLKNYGKSLFGTYFFDVFEISEDGDNYVLYANNLKFDEILRITTEYKYNFDFDTLNVKVTIPYKVISSNADIINDNIYIWIFNKDNYDRDIKIVYNKEIFENNLVTNDVSTIDKIGQTIINTVTFGTVDASDVGKGNGGVIVFVLVLVVIIVGILLFIRFVNKKNEI